MAKSNSVTIAADFEMASTIGARSGGGKIFSVTIADLPQGSIERILRYGFQRLINDGLGGADVRLADKIDAAQKKIDALKSGEVSARRNAAAGVDPVTHEARKLVRADLRKNKQVWEKFKALDEDKQIETLDKLLANPKNAHYLDDAKANVAAKAKAPTVDLGEIEI